MAVKTKQDATKILMNATGDKRFFCQDGLIRRNLAGFSDCFSRMTQGVFIHHVTGEKNDFSRWVNDVLGDTRRANELWHVASPADAEKVTRARTLELRRKV
jgi:hypothetical protein